MDKKADYMKAEGHHPFSHVSPAGLGDVKEALSPFLGGRPQVSWDNLRAQDWPEGKGERQMGQRKGEI